MQTATNEQHASCADFPCMPLTMTITPDIFACGLPDPSEKEQHACIHHRTLNPCTLDPSSSCHFFVCSLQEAGDDSLQGDGGGRGNSRRKRERGTRAKESNKKAQRRFRDRQKVRCWHKQCASPILDLCRGPYETVFEPPLHSKIMHVT